MCTLTRGTSHTSKCGMFRPPMQHIQDRRTMRDGRTGLRCTWDRPIDRDNLAPSLVLVPIGAADASIDVFAVRSQRYMASKHILHVHLHVRYRSHSKPSLHDERVENIRESSGARRLNDHEHRGRVDSASVTGLPRQPPSTTRYTNFESAPVRVSAR